MTNFPLSLGCALIAFGPIVGLFSSVIYNKAQLVIVVTSAAFFFLLSSFVAGLFWYIFYLCRLRGPMAAIIPGVLSQFAFRCMFVYMYHRVEKAIQQSVQQQEEDDATRREEREQVTRNTETTSTSARNKSSWTEVAKLRLELNDASCGIAAGVGFGGMHAVLMYGTLLASEMTNNVGVLYQESCPAVPSLAVSAVYAFFFSVLDIFFMLFTFFGMRRRRMYHRGERPNGDEQTAGSFLGNTRQGGNMALLSVLVAHFAASAFTTADYFAWGCVVSLPACAVVVCCVAYWFWAGVGRIYMPPAEIGEEEGSNRRGYNQHRE